VRQWQQVLALGQGPQMMEALASLGQRPRVLELVHHRALHTVQQGQLVPQALVLVQQVRVLLHCQLAVVRSGQ
jgi:hypothetical protein